MSGSMDSDRGAWANRRHGWGGQPPSGANGGRAGANGFGRAMLTIAGLLMFAGFVNIMTALDDARRGGAPIPVWQPLAAEVSSNLVLLMLAPFIYLIVRRVRRLAPWRRITLLIAGCVPYSLSHVALMTWARMAIFAAAGQSYTLSRGAILYEFRKDALTYAVLAGIFWFLTRPEGVVHETQGEPAPTTFDIQEGATLIRAAIDDILAVRAADNYVEFMLADGRKPLMRASLSSVEARLSATAIVRTHRSWLANPRHIRGITPAGSGDYRLDLGGDVIVPLSRRFPDVIARLRAEPAARP